MRHLAFLRVYLPLEHLHERIHPLALRAAKLTRDEIEAEAAQRLNRRLRPDTSRTTPDPDEPPIIRVATSTDLYGETRQFFHAEYLEHPELESQSMRRKPDNDELYAPFVPDEKILALSKIFGRQPDPESLTRPASTMSMQLKDVPLSWLAAFTVNPDMVMHDYHDVSESIIDGTRVVRRVRDFNAANSQLSWISHSVHMFLPDGPKHPYIVSANRVQAWLNRFNINSWERHTGLLELDYGALSPYAWPDTAGQHLAEGHRAVQRYEELESEAKQEFLDDNPDAEEDDFLGLPAVMLSAACLIMHTNYEAAAHVWERIRRNEHVN